MFSCMLTVANIAEQEVVLTTSGLLCTDLKMSGSYKRKSVASTPGAIFWECSPDKTRRIADPIFGVLATMAACMRPCVADKQTDPAVIDRQTLT
jgi:hypothetical protein